MNTHDAKTLPLNVLLGFLTSLYSDWDCTCNCQYETQLDNNHRDDRPAVIYSKNAVDWANIQREECKKNGCYWGWRSNVETETPYEDCPERIAYERIKEALEKDIAKSVLRVDEYFLCPTCQSWVNGNDYYCTQCGQKLDWEGDENA